MDNESKATWRIKDFYNADAELVRKELESIGDSTPQDIVDFAKNPDTELHKCFDWDVESAANKYWLVQARRVTCMLVFEPRKLDDVPIRVFSREAQEKVYKPTISFIRDEDSYQRLLKDAYADLIAFKQKYHSLTELESVFAEIDTLTNG